MYAKVAFAVLLLIAILAIPAVSASQNVDLDIEITPNYNLYPSEWRDQPGLEDSIFPGETFTISGSGLNIGVATIGIYRKIHYYATPGSENFELIQTATINNNFYYDYLVPTDFNINTMALIEYGIRVYDVGTIISDDSALNKPSGYNGIWSQKSIIVHKPPRASEIARYTGETETETVTATQTETEIRTLTATYTTTATLTNTVSETETETVTTTPTENQEIAELQQQIAEQQAQLDAQQEQLDEQQSWIDILLSFLGLK